MEVHSIYTYINPDKAWVNVETGFVFKYSYWVKIKVCKIVVLVQLHLHNMKFYIITMLKSLDRPGSLRIAWWSPNKKAKRKAK